ncbi:hypothetical protein ACFU6S_16905 [Streptomyces sp. NPDC057456]|uniref:hypothetical protein n=1 Tax=Streptomyces sp. NPDC057456 TaxID=3346139 RepID=UPI00368AE85B
MQQSTQRSVPATGRQPVVKMTTAADPMSVMLTLQVEEDGAVRVSGSSKGLSGCAAVPLAGQTIVVVDPADLRAPARIAVRDLDEGSWVLRPLLGETAFRKLGALVRERAPGKVMQEHVSTTLGAVWEDVAWLGTLLWIEEWSPLPLDRGLLDIDIAAASCACRALGTEELAAVRYRRCSSRLLELGEKLAEGQILETAPGLCSALINAPNYLWNLPDADAKRLDSLVATAKAVDPEGVGVPPIEAAEVLKRLGVNDGMSTLDGASPEETFSVDWHMVPPGVLDPRDDTIKVAYGDEMLTVKVRAAHLTPSTQLATRLKFRVLTRAGETAASGDLALDAKSGYYKGHIAQAQALAADTVVDVFAAGPGVPPPTKDRGLARIRRGAAWALSLERLASTGSDSASQELWREAAAHWFRVTTDLEQVRTKEECRSWKRTAVNHQAACWSRAGEAEKAKQAQARSGLPGDQESSGEPQTGSAGRPSLAELALVGALQDVALA